MHGGKATAAYLTRRTNLLIETGRSMKRREKPGLRGEKTRTRLYDDGDRPEVGRRKICVGVASAGDGQAPPPAALAARLTTRDS